MAKKSGSTPRGAEVWALARRQHGLVTRPQLVGLGYSKSGIHHRRANGRLHCIHRGVYAVGSPRLDRPGRLMAAVLACGPDAMISHHSAAGLWEIRSDRQTRIEVTIPRLRKRRPRGITVHSRRMIRPDERRTRHGIPVTSPILTLVDVSLDLSARQLEAAVNEADKRDLVDPDRLRAALDEMGGQPGVAPLRRLLDRRTFALTDSELERMFIPLARSAGLPLPETGVDLNGFRVDFFRPELGLVVETDGLRYLRGLDPSRDPATLRPCAGGTRSRTPIRGC